MTHDQLANLINVACEQGTPRYASWIYHEIKERTRGVEQVACGHGCRNLVDLYEPDKIMGSNFTVVQLQLIELSNLRGAVWIGICEHCNRIHWAKNHGYWT